MGLFTRTPDPPSTVPMVKPAGEAARVIKPSELLAEAEARRASDDLPTEDKTERRSDGATKKRSDGPTEGLCSAARLEELELTIRQSKVAWIVAARSLVEIRDRQLYKPYAETMDAYLETRGKERFGIKKRRCHDLMRAAVVAKRCRHVTNEFCLAAMLVLADLPKDKQAFGMGEAIKLAKCRNPSASQVAEAIAPFVVERQKAEGRRQKKKQRPKPIKYRSKAGVATVVLKTGCDLRQLLLEWLADLDRRNNSAA